MGAWCKELEDAWLLLTIPGMGVIFAVTILAQISWRASGGSKSLDDFKQRLGERRPKMVASTAAARKLLAIIWSMLTNRMPFRDQDADLSARKWSSLKAWPEPYAWMLEVLRSRTPVQAPGRRRERSKMELPGLRPSGSSRSSRCVRPVSGSVVCAYGKASFGKMPGTRLPPACCRAVKSPRGQAGRRKADYGPSL